MRCSLDLVAVCVLASVLCQPLRAATEPGSGDSRFHLEACSKWTEQDGSFGFTNGCGEPVALIFVELGGQRRFDRVIKPKERFESRLSEKTINASSWLYTICPAGYVPDVPFTAENWPRIVSGRYECVRR